MAYYARKNGVTSRLNAPGSGGSGSGGHVIENGSGTPLAQRANLQFKGVRTSDDSTNDRTVVDATCETIDWEDWIEMSSQEQEAYKIAHPDLLILDAPGADGNISADLLTELWSNPSPTSAFTAQNIELSSGDYDFLLFVVRATSGANRQVSEIISKGSGIIMSYTVDRNVRSRLAEYTNDTKYAVADAISSTIGGPTSETNNLACIPYKIYGIKKTINLNFSAIASDVSTSADKCMLSDGVTSVEDALVSRPLITQDSIKAQVKNGILYISTDSVTPPSVGSWALITTLPVGYRPNTSAYFVAIAPASNNAICSAFINPRGEVSIKSNNSYNYVFSGALPIKED